MEETKSVEQLKVENKALWQSLTKRNEQYMLGLDRTLRAANLEEGRREEIYNKMMRELAEAQKTGKTARQLYGTVSECASNILVNPADAEVSVRSSDLLIAMDGGLLLGAIFALISGVSLLTNSEEGVIGMGLISLILNFLVGGITMLVISKYTPNPDAPKGEKGFGKYILATTGAMLSWMLIMTASMMFIPASINVAMPAFAYIAIGAVAFAAKIYLKKKYHIMGGIF
ncbi:DUF1129 domain-containing protein [Trichococcus ilyis]|uniref:Uncharacterized membrane-anchored protein n=1 Tax=Trichococcus ilyis TaxID=640938 RepID=A0A143YD74_9LACT|nr:DUF1129 family protein [Trichococcus ilyis]CZQ85495.1 Hypothetical protein TR210_464 [Trichococcus ilyis]SEJ57627.1 Uncharacterized membrane-anchored protein [Trichococcus ilyis]